MTASFGYGTAFLRIPGTTAVLFGWIEGTKRNRLARWDLTTGEWEQIPALGMPRDAIFDGDRAFVLTTHGVHEVQLHPLKSIRERTEGIPEWSLAMRPLPGTDDALVWKRKGKTCVRISLAGESASRVSRPAPNVVTTRGKALVALSFERGVGWKVDRPRDQFAIPMASAAIAIGARILVAPGTLGPARNVTPVTQTDEVFDIHNDGSLAEYTFEGGLGRSLVDVGAPIVGLDGPTDDGHVLVRTRDHLLWVDIERGTIVARRAVVTGPVCVLGNMVLVAPPLAEQPALLLGVGDEAAAAIARAVPAKQPAISAKKQERQARAAEQGIIEGRIFKGVEVKGTLGPAHFRACEFDHCRVGDRSSLTEVRGVTLERCTLARGFIQRTKVIDSRFERIRLRGGWNPIQGIDFLRVVLAGPFDGNLIFQHHPPEMLARTGPDEWALDISQAQFSGIELRGMPSRLVRRDPETQFVVRRERAADRRWQTLPVGAYSVTLGDLLANDREDAVLVACRRGRNFAEQLAALRLLRSEGIAEPD